MTIRDIITILISAILIENVLLSQFLGVCSFLGVSKSRKNAVGMVIYQAILEKFKLIRTKMNEPITIKCDEFAIIWNQQMIH